MHLHHIPWGALFLTLLHLLKAFGLIPGALAAFGVRKFYQKWRQNKAMSGWPATDATIQNGKVHKDGWRVWVELTYTYYVGEYRSGTHVHKFRRAGAGRGVHPPGERQTSARALRWCASGEVRNPRSRFGDDRVAHAAIRLNSGVDVQNQTTRSLSLPTLSLDIGAADRTNAFRRTRIEKRT